MNDSFDVAKTMRLTKFKKLAKCMKELLGETYRTKDLSKLARLRGMNVCGENTYEVVSEIREALDKGEQPGPPLPKVKVDEPEKKKKVDKTKEPK